MYYLYYSKLPTGMAMWMVVCFCHPCLECTLAWSQLGLAPASLWHTWTKDWSNLQYPTSNSSSWWEKAPKLGSPRSLGFLRPPDPASPRRRPPEPREEIELEELGVSLCPCAVGNDGRLYGGISSATAQTARTENVGDTSHSKPPKR